jgi:hypothetical protein
VYEETMTQYHRCPECEEVMSLDEDNFYREANSPNGFMNVCKSCKRTYQAYRIKHPKWMETHVTGETTSFDKACERDRIKRLFDTSGISIFRKAF